MIGFVTWPQVNEKYLTGEFTKQCKTSTWILKSQHRFVCISLAICFLTICIMKTFQFILYASKDREDIDINLLYYYGKFIAIATYVPYGTLVATYTDEKEQQF